MFPNSSRWFRQFLRSVSGRQIRGRRRAFRGLSGPRLESLEARCLPAAIVVNSLLDNTTSADGLVTLREAILAANGDTTTDLGHTGSGADTITFAPGLIANGPATISLSTIGNTTAGPSAFGITSEITIQGLQEHNGITIERNSTAGNMRLFYVASTGSLTLDSVTLSGGVAKGGNGGNGGGGGAAGMGGAIFNQGSLTVSKSTLSNNAATGGNGGNGTDNSGGGGGGLGSGGQGSMPFGGAGGGPNSGSAGGQGGNGGNGGFGGGGGGGGFNFGDAGDGGAGGFGGGGGAGGRASAVATYLGGDGGVGGFGGGGGGGGGSQGSPVGAGVAGGFGGGAGLPGDTGGRTGAGGGGAGMGGAIFNAAGTVTITNSTLAGNSATGGNGGSTSAGAGGAYGGAFFSLNGNVTILYSTIATNSVTAGTGASPTVSGAGAYILGMDGTGVGAAAGTTHSFANNIVASNTGTGNQFTTAASLATTLNGLTNYFASTSTLLGPLQWNGGPTRTIAIANDSQVVNVGSSSTLSTDQRGSTRPLGTSRDFGAFELGNSTPTDISLSSASIAENAGTSALVGTVSTTDADVSDTFTYTFFNAQLGDDDNSAFTLSGNQLLANSSFDFETKNSYLIRVKTTDANGLSYFKAFTISVTDGSDFSIGAVSDNDATANSVAENASSGATVGLTAHAVDPDSIDTVTYELTSNAGGLFAINSSTGVVTLNAALDYETATSHQITVKAISTDGSSASQTFTIQVTDVDEFNVSTPVDTDGTAGATVAEDLAVNSQVGITAFATDPDASNNTVTYELTNNAGGLFAINSSTGIVTLNAALDYETATSHQITVKASSTDGSSASQTFTINVTDVNEGDLGLLTDSDTDNNLVDENSPIGTKVGVTALAIDPDGTDTVTYELAGGEGKFAIDPNTGVVTVAGALDFETESSYIVAILATSSDGTQSADSFIIDVANVIEPPELKLSRTTINERNMKKAVVGNFSVNDVDNSSLTYTLVKGDGGIDNKSFLIVGNQLQAKRVFNFEKKSVYSIRVLVTGPGGLSQVKNFTINVTNVNERPTSITLTNLAVQQQQPVGTVVGLLAAVDPDAGNTHTFLLSGANPDNASFEIVGNELRTTAVFDYALKRSYIIRIRAVDQGSFSYERQFTIRVLA